MSKEQIKSYFKTYFKENIGETYCSHDFDGVTYNCHRKGRKIVIQKGGVNLTDEQRILDNVGMIFHVKPTEEGKQKLKNSSGEVTIAGQRFKIYLEDTFESLVGENYDSFYKADKDESLYEFQKLFVKNNTELYDEKGFNQKFIKNFKDEKNNNLLEILALSNKNLEFEKYKSIKDAKFKISNVINDQKNTILHFPKLINNPNVILNVKKLSDQKDEGLHIENQNKKTPLILFLEKIKDLENKESYLHILNQLIDLDFAPGDEKTETNYKNLLVKIFSINLSDGQIKTIVDKVINKKYPKDKQSKKYVPNINIKDGKDDPLMLSLRLKNTTIINIFLKNYVYVENNYKNLTGNDGNPALIIAIDNKTDPKVLEYWINQATSDENRKNLYKTLIKINNSRYGEIIANLLIKKILGTTLEKNYFKQKINNTTILILAIENKSDPRIIEKIIKNTNDETLRIKQNDKTALRLAINNKLDYKTIIEPLITKTPIDVIKIESESKSMLINEIDKEQKLTEIIKGLSKKFKSVLNKLDKDGNNVLHYVASKKYLDIVKHLIQYYKGALISWINNENRDNKTVYQILLDKGILENHVTMKKLKEAGAK